MKLLKNRIFATILTGLVILGCCAYGFTAKPNETAADLEPLEYGKAHYTAYLDWIADEAGLLSEETERTVASYMAALDHGWGSIVTVVTEDSGGAALESRAMDWADHWNLSGRDMILLLDTSSDNWYLKYGADIGPYVDKALQSIFTACFDTDSVTDNADAILTELFPDLYSWYADTLTAQDDGSGVFPVLLGFGFVALLILVIAIASAASLGRGGKGGGGGGTRYRTGPTVFWGPTVFFPGRFGGPFGPRPPHHGPRHDGHNHDQNDWPIGGGFGGGGFGGGGFGGGDRGGSFGGGGGFGGGDRGGGFGG